MTGVCKGKTFPADAPDAAGALRFSFHAVYTLMMMAHDSSPPPERSLAEDTVERARLALSKYLTDSDGPAAAELRDVLDVMSSEARALQMLPEQLLVVLKDIWYSLPAVRAIEDSGAQIRLLQRVVTMCIKEYYR